MCEPWISRGERGARDADVLSRCELQLAVFRYMYHNRKSVECWHILSKPRGRATFYVCAVTSVSIFRKKLLPKSERP